MQILSSNCCDPCIIERLFGKQYLNARHKWMLPEIVVPQMLSLDDHFRMKGRPSLLIHWATGYVCCLVPKLLENSYNHRNGNSSRFHPHTQAHSQQPLHGRIALITITTPPLSRRSNSHNPFHLHWQHPTSTNTFRNIRGRGKWRSAWTFNSISLVFQRLQEWFVEMTRPFGTIKW